MDQVEYDRLMKITNKHFRDVNRAVVAIKRHTRMLPDDLRRTVTKMHNDFDYLHAPEHELHHPRFLLQPGLRMIHTLPHPN